MTYPTPTDSGLDFRPGQFDTLSAALDYAAKGATGTNFYSSDGSLVEAVSYADLRTRSLALAGRLAASFPRLTRIGLIAETSPDFLVAFMACQYAGIIPAPMSLPAAFGGREAYEWQISRMAHTADLAAVMTPAELMNIVGSAMSGMGIPVHALDGGDLTGGTATPVAFTADEPAYMQFSSGSTSDPKGIFATQASVMANVHAIANEGLKIRHDDRMVSWLPLYHDMGIVGFFMVPMSTQNSLDYISPTNFARRPMTWLKLISDNRATITYSPSFGYGLAARRYKQTDLDLSTLRVAGIGGDMVQNDVLEQFSETFGPCGYSAGAFVASYGLAETTLAASFAPLDAGAVLDTVDLAEMQASGRAIPAAEILRRDAKLRTFTSCGRPLPSMQMRVLDERGAELSDRQVGRVMLKGPSLAAGYYRAGKPLKQITDADGWFETGDLGYMLDGEIYITGRSKDLMIYNGRNIWPQDLEWIAQKVGGPRIPRAAAFDVANTDGSSQILLLAECNLRDADERADLVRDVTKSVRSAIGAPFEIVLVNRHSLPMTSSGKLSRAGAKARYLDGQFAENLDRPHMTMNRVAHGG